MASPGRSSRLGSARPPHSSYSLHGAGPFRTTAQLLIIFNPHSGRARAIGRAAVERALTARGLDYELAVPGSPEEAAAAATEAAAAGRTVVAAGGDGTVHIVANGALAAGNADAELGVLPLGSGNDFAASLGRVAASLNAAAAALARPRRLRVDVGQVNGREYFINGLGIGFDAEVVRTREGKSVGALGYTPTVLRTILSYEPRHYRVRWSGGEVDGPGLMLAVMNGVSEGGGFRLAPDAALDDGALDICWIDPINLWQFVRYVSAVRRGTHGALPMVRAWRCSGLSVESAAPISYHMDGEYRQLERGQPLTVELHSRRLQVIV